MSVVIIPDAENVARAIFSPKMIKDGEILPEAFRLRSSISEDYLSVMRMSVQSWVEDIKQIPQRKNRKLYGFAESGIEEDFMMLAVQRELVDIAQKGLYTI